MIIKKFTILKRTYWIVLFVFIFLSISRGIAKSNISPEIEPLFESQKIDTTNSENKKKINTKNLILFESTGSGIEIKGKKTEIPFGKKIVLSGTHSTLISEMSIRQIYGNVDEEIETKVSNRNWYAVTGPFPVNEEIVLIFDIKSPVTENERAKLIQNFEEAFDDFLDDLFNTGLNTDEEIREALHPFLLRNLPIEFQNYLTTDNTSLEQLIIKTLLDENSSKIFNLIDVHLDIPTTERNLNAEIKNLIYLFDTNNILDLFTKQYSPDNNSFQADSTLISNITNASNDDLSNLKEKRDRLNEIINSLRIPEDEKKLIIQTVEVYISTKQTLDDLEKTKEELLNNLYQETIEKIKTIELFSVAALQSGFQVKDIEFYAGFDLGENYLLKGNSVSTLFTINIYAKKIDLNEPFQSKAFWDFITSRFSLSAGLGIYTPNVEKNGPLYFIGGGFRINKVFRANLGYAFFKTEENKFTGHTSLGLSVGFRHVTDILQIFNGTTSNFQN